MKIFILIFTVFSYLLLAQDEKRIVAVGKYTGGQNTTSEEVYKKALENARNKAIEQAFGVYVKQETQKMLVETSLNSEIIDQFSQLSRTTTFAKIVDETVLESNIITDTSLSLQCIVKIEVLVVKELDLPDPDFQVNLDLNKNVFYVNKSGLGEEIKLKITANRDCYLYLFNLMSNDSVKLVMPSQLLPNNFYSSTAKKQDYEKILDRISFNVMLPAGKEALSEGLYLIALKEKVDFSNNSFTKDNNDVIPTYKAAIYDIQKWLVRIPNNKRTEKLKVYEIRKL